MRSLGRLAVWVSRLAQPVSQRTGFDGRGIIPKVRSSFVASARTYGARRVWRDVLADGVSCGLHRIERLMRGEALQARPRRRGLPKNEGERSISPASNVLDRQFTAQRPNQKWIADFNLLSGRPKAGSMWPP